MFNSASLCQTGTVFNIQRFSLNDGPGIRTVVFLKGCPLHCPWCSNPESQSPYPEIMYRSDKCLHCGACASVCPDKLISLVPGSPNTIDRAKCSHCGSCASVCPNESISLSGREQSVDEVLTEIIKDDAFYRSSGGGVTLSGGEPLAHGDFARELLSGCRQKGIHTAVETTGNISHSSLEEVSPFIDLYLFDIKHLDADKLKEVTGAELDLILHNLDWLLRNGKNVIIRLPVIPGFNDDSVYLDSLKRFLCESNVREVHVLPYHVYGRNKYRYLNRSYHMPEDSMDDSAADFIVSALKSDAYAIKLHG